MNAPQPIFVIESNDFVVKKLSEGLNLYGFSEGVNIISDASDMADSAVIHVSYPIRLGGLIDQIEYFQQKNSVSQRDIISFGGYRLDRHQGLFYIEGEANPLRLTEKEVALLVLLYEAQGEAVSRETLLEKIWQYAESVETHTLETHIYRLRQKVESDPAEPQLLRTNENGYFLSIECV